MKSRLRLVIPMTLCAGMTVFATGCGKKKNSSSGGSVTEWLKTFAQGLAVASPTASSNSLLTQSDSGSVDSSADFQTKAEAIASIAEAKSTEGCKVVLPHVNGLGSRTNCFGPQVNYSNHPNGADQTPAQLPGGDLGIWNSTETDGSACAAAQMNTLVGSASNFVDIALLLQASSVCVLSNNSVSLPSSGDTVDFTDKFSSALASGNTATVTSATVKAVDDTTYEYTFAGTTDGSNAYSITIVHAAADSENSSYTGRIYGYWTHGSSRDGFSVKYSKTGDDMSARMAAGQYQATATSSTIFNSDGDIAMSGWSGNMNHAIFNINASTGVGSVSYAWQAGSGDSNTRVFNVYTSGTPGSLSGCGFFGYGNAFSTTLASNTNSITGFICNWAGPGAQSHATAITSNLLKAQKQCFAQNGSGVFVPTSGKNKIRYAPTNSCDENSSFTYDWPTSLGDNTTTDNVTNDLVTLSSDTDFGSYTAPTSP